MYIHFAKKVLKPAEDTLKRLLKIAASTPLSQSYDFLVGPRPTSFFSCVNVPPVGAGLRFSLFYGFYVGGRYAGDG